MKFRMSMDFEYKIIEKNDFVVITFKGRISKEAKKTLEDCIEKIESFESKTFALLFKDVSGFDQSASREFSLLLQEIRKKNTRLYLVGLNLSLKLELNDRGLIRLKEVRNSLEEVFKRGVPNNEAE
jgi:anti-anti-sigma regulatory factor